MSRRASRRQFLRNTTLAGVGFWVAGGVSLGEEKKPRSPLERLRIAGIGVGGKGSSDVDHAGAVGDVVALCDIDDTMIEKKQQKRFPQARKFNDFREMLTTMDKDIDAVTVSTPDHTHAPAAVMAMKLKKHVYCQKPLTHSVYESRVMRETAKQMGVCTQMGNQGTASDGLRTAVEMIQSGVIGPVSEAHVWVARAWGLQSEAAATRNRDIVYVRERPTEQVSVPTGLDWDLWLGPAPSRPFHNVYFPGPKWYRWWDFGNGTMSDLGSHWLDLPFWALKLDAPKTVEAFGAPPHPEIAPASLQVTYEYGPRDEMLAVTVHWYQGEDKPEAYKSGAIPKWDSAVLFVGSKGMLLSNYGKHMLLPEDQFRDFQRPEPFIAKSLGHYAEWVHACKTGAPTTCNFEYAGRLTEANHLGNVAFRAGKKLEWDTIKLYASNAPEAEPFIHREYRKGWSLG